MSAHTTDKWRERERQRVRSAREKYVYVIEFASGTIKVGQTREPLKRFEDHATGAVRHGDSIKRTWASKPHVGYADNEKSMIAFCAARWSTTTGIEYFSGADFDAIVAYATGLPMVPLPESEVDKHFAMKEELEDQLRKSREDAHRQDVASKVAKLADQLSVIGALMNDGNKQQSVDMAVETGKKIMEHVAFPWAKTDPDAAQRYLIGCGYTAEEARERARDFELTICAMYALHTDVVPTSFDDIARFADQVMPYADDDV